MIKQQAFVIEGWLDSMNTVIHENRRHRMAGAREKKAQQCICAEAIRACGVQPVKTYPVCIKINWIEPNARRDPDNIATGKKFIFDALQETGVLRNDSMKEIRGITEAFGVDNANPRIVVIIEEEN